MDPNIYLPPALPLLNDAELMRLKREYRAVHADHAAPPPSPHKRQLIAQALDAIETELNARGIDAEPWWAGPHTDRPPRRLDHAAAPALRQLADGGCP
jgi:hypothetical protein